MSDKFSENASRYAAFMDAQERIQYHEYVLRLDSERLDRIIGIEDVSDLVANILATEAEITRLRAIRP